MTRKVIERKYRKYNMLNTRKQEHISSLYSKSKILILIE